MVPSSKRSSKPLLMQSQLQSSSVTCRGSQSASTPSGPHLLSLSLPPTTAPKAGLLSLQQGILSLRPSPWLFPLPGKLFPQRPAGRTRWGPSALLCSISHFLATYIKLHPPYAFYPPSLLMFLKSTVHHQTHVALFYIPGWLAPQLECQLQEGRDAYLFCSLLHPLPLEQGLVQS